jgi:hypothetical protein
MILRIANNLYIGKEEGLVFTNRKEWAIIHANQSYHYKVMGWSIHNRPKKDDKNYLYSESSSEISLNWVDGGPHLYEWYGPEFFIKLLDFIDKHIKERKVFIHCDLGISRSPTLALIYLAKRANTIDNYCFEDAYKGFIKIYPQYKPGGIASYIEQVWTQII